MPWVKIDDRFFTNPKVMRAGRDARDIYLAAMCYAAGELTDGFIPDDTLPMLAVLAGVPDFAACVERLVAVGLWELAAGGYQLHDWSKYNPPAEQVKREREANAERQARWRLNHPERNLGRHAERNALHVTESNAPVTPAPYPCPSNESLLRNEDAPEAASAVPASVKPSRSKPKHKTDTSEKKTPPKRGQNEQWDALVDVLYQPTTTAERSNFGMVARDLREAGATGDEIRRRAANQRAMLESGVIPWELTTPNALLKHWTELAEIRQPRASPKRDWVNGRAPQTPADAPHRLVTAKDADPFKSLPDSA